MTTKKTKPGIHSIALTFLMSSFALHAHAQSSSVSTHILTFAPASLPEGFLPYYQKSGAAEPFVASVGTLGLPTPYSGPSEFALYGSKDELDAKSKPPIATVTLPEKCDLVLLVCTRDAEEKTSLVAYNIDSEDLKPGNYRIFNFSKSTVSITLDKQTIEIAPDKDAYVRDPKWHDQPTAFPLQIATIANGKTKRAYSSFWEHFPTRRNLMFLFDGSGPSEPITFATFDAESVPKKKARGK